MNQVANESDAAVTAASLPASLPALFSTQPEADTTQDVEVRPLTASSRATQPSIMHVRSKRAIIEREVFRFSEWGWEVIACFYSLAGFGGIVGLLIAFDGQSQPDWPYGITINAALALLATGTKRLLLVPATACIGQSIWTDTAKREYRMGLMSTYDAASRGPWGCLQLLWRLKSRYVMLIRRLNDSNHQLERRKACIGAIFTIPMAGISPAVQ